jgi:hypothetical protein
MISPGSGARRAPLPNLFLQRRAAAGVYLEKRQFDVGLISPFGPRGARPKWRKIVPRSVRGTIFCTCRVHVERVNFACAKRTQN